MTIVHVLAFLALCFLPGAWIAFHSSRTDPLLPRIALAVAFSPVVLIVEFLLLALMMRIPFDATVVILVVINIPSVVAIARYCTIARPHHNSLRRWWLLISIPLATMVPHFVDIQTQAYIGHSWLYSDTIYQISNDVLWPEESLAAGLSLAYPWGAMIVHAILSTAIDMPPMASYMWINLIWLLAVIILVSRIGDKLGGGGVSAASTAVWLLLGTNFLGDFTRISGWIDTQPWSEGLWADGRFTPWFSKFFFMPQQSLGLTLCVALLYNLSRHLPWQSTRPSVAIENLLLLGGVSFAYPILFPAALAFFVGRIVMAAWWNGSARLVSVGTDSLVVLGGGIVTGVTVWMASLDRIAPSVIPAGGLMMGKLFSIPVILLPLLLCVGFVWRRSFERERYLSFLLVWGAFCSALLYVGFHLPGWSNEYKFVFTLALCLAPFGGAATERFHRRCPHLALSAFAALTLVMTMPLAWRVWQGYPLDVVPGPAVDVSDFDLDLAANGSWESVLPVAIRERSPRNAIVVVKDSSVHLATLMQRSLYSPANGEQSYPGIGMTGRQTLFVSRGYDPAVVERRWNTLQALFEGSTTERDEALRAILALGRPVVLLINSDLCPRMEQWLENSSPRATSIGAASSVHAWLITSSD